MSNDVSINVKANDQASATFGKVTNASDDMASKIGGKITQLGNNIGGEVGEIVTKFGEGFEKIATEGTSAFTKIQAGSAVIGGIGIAIQAMTSKSSAAEQQLEAQVNTTGDSWSDYSGKVSDAISMEAKYAHGISDTDSALQILDQATGSMDTSLADLTLTTNLAAAKHISLADAATLVAKIYSGSSKTLKQYGIDMTVTAGNTDEATAAINQLSAKVSGQADASVNTFSGRVAAAKTEIQDWGDQVLSVAGGPLTALSGATSLVTGVMEIGATVIDVVKSKHAANAVAIVGEAGATDKLAASATLAAAAESELAGAEDEAGASMLAGVGPAGLVLAGVVALGVALDPLANKVGNWVDANSKGIESLKGLKSTIDSLSTSVHEDGDAFGDASVKIVSAGISSSGLAASFKGTGVTLAQLTGAVGLNKDAFEKQIDTWKQAGKINDGQVLALTALWGGTQSNIQSDKDLTAAQIALGVSSATLTDDNGALSKSFQDSADAITQGTTAAGTAVSRYSDALTKLKNPTEDLDRAQDAMKDGLAGITDDIKTNGKSLDDNTVKGRANENWLRDQIDAYTTTAQKQIAAGQSTDQVSAALAQNEAQLKQTAIANGMNATQVQNLLDKEGNIKPLITTQISVDASVAFASLNTLEARTAYVLELMRTGDAADASNLSNGMGSNTRANSSDGRASGGNVGGAATGRNAGGLLWVGEHGPELVNLPGGSHVNSNPDSMRMAGGGGGVQVSFEVGGNGSAFDQFMLQWMRQNVRVKGGGSVQAAFG